MQISRVGIANDADRAVADCMERAIRDFESLGVANIQKACEARRCELVQTISTLAASNNLSEQTVRAELNDEFNLVDLPTDLELDFRVRNGPCAMIVDYLSTPRRIQVHTEQINLASLTLKILPWMSVRYASFHEMLHICGEGVDRKTGEAKNDGFVRMNMAGVDALAPLLSNAALPHP